MWLTKLTIITCLLLATGYAQRTRPSRRPPTEAPEPKLIPKESGCLAELQAQQDIMVQSNLPRRFLVVSRRRSSRMFGRTFNNVNGLFDLQISTASDTYNSTNGVSVVTTTKEGIEEVSLVNNILMHASC